MHQELELIENRKTGRSSTPSAKLHPVAGDRFSVLRDSPVDGNQFLPDVAGIGASAAIASDPTRAMNSPSDLALLQVQDTLTALHKLAPSYRQLMPQRPESSPVPISRGTTTTKFYVADYRAAQPVATQNHTSSTFRSNQASLLEGRVRLALMLVAVVAVAIRLAYVATLDRARLSWSDEVA